MEQWLHNFTQWLGAGGWDVHVGLASGRRFNDPETYLLAHPHLRSHVLDGRGGTERARVAAVQDLIAEVKPDLVIPIALGSVFPAVARAKRRGSKTRLLVPVRSLAPALLVNVCDFLPVIDGVVTVSRLLHRFFRGRIPESMERIHYVRHGARPGSTLPDPSRREDSSAPLRIGYVGRLEAVVKRVLDLVALADELERQQVDAELHVFGSGPEEDALRNALAKAGVPHVLHGYCTQEALYQRAYPGLDVLVLFSAEEGTPNVVCEAMHHGVVPVIARYLGQSAEGFVIDGRNGLTFPVGAVDRAAHAIARLSRERSRLRQLSAAALADVAGDTDVRMHEDWVQIFRRTVERPLAAEECDRLGRVPPAGRLERVLPGRTAGRVRTALGRDPGHADGWAEWPATQPVRAAYLEDVRERLKQIDLEDRAEAVAP